MDEALFSIPTELALPDKMIKNFGIMGITIHIKLARVADDSSNQIVEKLEGYTVLSTSINMVSAGQLIQRLHTYIADHVAEDLSLSALAQTVFLSPVYLSRLYKQLTGSNLSEYVQSVRLEHARSLLEHGAVRVSDIAYQSGFESAAHFSRTFKKAFGITPQEYRNSISTH